jgi:hypothetical protein
MGLRQHYRGRQPVAGTSGASVIVVTPPGTTLVNQVPLDSGLVLHGRHVVHVDLLMIWQLKPDG